MHAYQIDTDAGFTATVFAEWESMAVTLFCIHHEVMTDVMPTDFDVSRIQRMLTPLAQEDLANALASKISGIGYHISGRGWTIMPPDVVMDVVENHSAWAHIEALGEQAPRRLYRLFTDVEERFIFARHIAEAIKLDSRWSEASGCRMERAAIDSHWAKVRNGIEAEHLDAALSRRQSGIGKYDPNTGWTISDLPGLRAV